MECCFYRPTAPLDRFVDFLWVIRGGEMDRKERILPTGTSELVINLHEDEIRIYNRSEKEGYRGLSGAVVSGAYSGVFACDAAQHRSIIGVHFLPAGAFPFFAAPASDLAELHTDLEDLWGPAAVRSLRARLLEADAAPELFPIMEQALMGRIREAPARNPVIDLAFHRFRPRGTGSCSREIAREACMSQRPEDRLGGGGGCLRILRSVAFHPRISKALRRTALGIREPPSGGS